MNTVESKLEVVPLPAGKLDLVLSRIPRAVNQVLQEHPALYIAGGFIRSIFARETVRDIDIFSGSFEHMARGVSDYRAIIGARYSNVRERLTPCTTMFETGLYPVQFVTYIEQPWEQGLSQFDFTICQAALRFNPDSGWESICTPEFLRDVAARQLVYTSPERVEAPGGSLWRALKFVRRGYSITQEELAKLVVRLNNGLKAKHVGCEVLFNLPPECNETVVRQSFHLNGHGYF